MFDLLSLHQVDIDITKIINEQYKSISHISLGPGIRFGDAIFTWTLIWEQIFQKGKSIKFLKFSFFGECTYVIF